MQRIQSRINAIAAGYQHFFLDRIFDVLYSICPFLMWVPWLQRNSSAWEVL